jgi:sec-independent protein translocase protein TatA
MFAIFSMGMQELVIIGIIAVLLFGKRLPEVARSLGASYRDFRKGLSDLQSQVDIRDTFSSTSTPSSSSSSSTSYTGTTYGDFDDYDEATAPKFEPPPSPPQADEDVPPSDEVPKPISEK